MLLVYITRNKCVECHRTFPVSFSCSSFTQNKQFRRADSTQLKIKKPLHIFNMCYGYKKRKQTFLQVLHAV